MASSNKKLIIIGAGGHAKVVLDIALKNNYTVLGFLDDRDEVTSVCDYKVLGKTATCMNYIDDPEIEFIIAIGNNHDRRAIAEKYPVRWATLIHPRAVIGVNTTIGEGTVIMANAVVNPGAVVGSHVIINTAAIVEHDNRIGNYVHISPGAVLSGTVTIYHGTHIGSGAVVKNNISITSDCLIGAGAVVVSNIVSVGTYIGVPAKKMHA